MTINNPPYHDYPYTARVFSGVWEYLDYAAKTRAEAEQLIFKSIYPAGHAIGAKLLTDGRKTVVEVYGGV